MIVNNLDIPNVTIRPPEANAPLSVDADRVLSFAITFQRLKTITRR